MQQICGQLDARPRSAAWAILKSFRSELCLSSLAAPGNIGHKRAHTSTLQGILGRMQRLDQRGLRATMYIFAPQGQVPLCEPRCAGLHGSRHRLGRDAYLQVRCSNNKISSGVKKSGSEAGVLFRLAQRHGQGDGKGWWVLGAAVLQAWS
jgi:hypothetical protein